MTDKRISDIYDSLKLVFADQIQNLSVHNGTHMILVKSQSIHEVLATLKESHNFTYLADIFGADRFTSTERFEVIYNLVSLKQGLRIFVKTRCPEENPVLPTSTNIWEAANWNEREVYDMFGIVFEGHPDPRRIFMPEDFEYFPLRKEFPLLGIPGSIELPNTSPEKE